MDKALLSKTPEEIFSEAAQDKELSKRDLRLLTSGLAALRATKEKGLNKIERQALEAMIAYIAHTSKKDEKTVYSMVETKFEVSEVEKIPSQRYQEAIEYLVELDPAKIVN